MESEALKMGLIKTILKSGDALVDKLPEVIDLGMKMGSDAYEQQKALIKIPGLKDVHIDEAVRVLNELHLIPTLAIAKPAIAYAEENENKVMNSEPKFGTRVNPGTPVIVYYLTQEVIEKSKILLETAVTEFKIPMVIGLNVNEAREDLEGLGLRVSEKLDKPSVGFANKEDGQVTRITYPDNQKTGPKLKTGERVWLYYVNDEVILESESLRIKKEKERQELMEKIGKATKDISKGISTGTKEATAATKGFAKIIRNQIGKIKTKSYKKDE